MNLEAAKEFMYKCHQENLTNKEIARRLKARGYVSPRTGEAINQFGVGFHIRQMKVKKAPPMVLAAERREPTPTRGAKSRLELALEVLESSDLDRPVKLEIARKLLA